MYVPVSGYMRVPRYTGKRTADLYRDEAGFFAKTRTRKYPSTTPERTKTAPAKANAATSIGLPARLARRSSPTPVSSLTHYHLARLDIRSFLP
jgi:hypothetical protein